MSKRPIVFMSLYNTQKFWHADPSIGINVTAKEIRIKNFGRGRRFTTADEFLSAFRKIVGSYGLDGVGLGEEEIDEILLTE